jgi:internalin A
MLETYLTTDLLRRIESRDGTQRWEHISVPLASRLIATDQTVRFKLTIRGGTRSLHRSPTIELRNQQPQVIIPEFPDEVAARIVQVEKDNRVSEITAEAVASICRLPMLTTLILKYITLSPEHFSSIAKAPHLVELNLQGGEGKICDSDVSALRRLKALNLSQTSFNDACLEALSGSELEELDVSFTKVTDSGMRHLRRLPNLKHLSVGGLEIHDLPLSTVPGIERVSVKSTGIQYLDFSANASLKAVTTWASPIANNWLSTLNRSCVEEIDFDQLPVGCDAALMRMSALKHLSIQANVPLEDRTVHHLSNLPQLSHVYLLNCPYANAIINTGSSFSLLESFAARNSYVSSETAHWLLHNAPLREFEVEGSHIDNRVFQLGPQTRMDFLWLHDTAVSRIGSRNAELLLDVESLDLSYTNISDSDCQELADFIEVRYLGLSDTDIGTSGLAAINRLRNLNFLKLSGTKVTDESLLGLYGMENLRRLIIVDCAVTSKAVYRLQMQLPGCDIEF